MTTITAAIDAPPALLTLTTLLSLSSTLLILGLAYLSLRLCLPTSGSYRASTRTQLLFLWHAFDCLIHFTLEASYLYNCFFSYTSLPLPSSNAAIASSVSAQTSKGLWTNVKSSVADLLRDSNAAAANSIGLSQAAGPAINGLGRSMTPPNVFFLGQTSRLYGAFYSTSPTAKLWQEYARADARWGGADLGIISLELLTVFVMAPLSVLICYYLYSSHLSSSTTADRARASAKAWILMIAVATGELYGGFMTFAPEWLSGNSNLETGNWMFLWVYLVFFNGLWVGIPGWVLWEGWGVVVGRFVSGEAGSGGREKEKMVTRGKKGR